MSRWRHVEEREDETKKRGKRKRQRGASALGRELERWIFFMKEFERRIQRGLLGLSLNHEKPRVPKLKPEFAKMKIRPQVVLSRRMSAFLSLMINQRVASDCNICVL